MARSSPWSVLDRQMASCPELTLLAGEDASQNGSLSRTISKPVADDRNTRDRRRICAATLMSLVMQGVDKGMKWSWQKLSERSGRGKLRKLGRERREDPCKARSLSATATG